MSSNTYIGKGTVYIRKSTETSLSSLGNCSKLSLNISEDKKELMDYENAGGGMSDRISRVKSVSLNVTSHKITADNLLSFLRGTSTVVPSAVVQNEYKVDVQLDKLVVLDKVPSGALTIVKSASYVSSPEVHNDIVINTEVELTYPPVQASIVAYKYVGGTNTLLTLGTDYTTSATGITPLAGGPATLANDNDLKITYCKASGVLSSSTDYTATRSGFIPKTGGTIFNNNDLYVTYTSAATTDIEPIVATNADYVVFFDGLNEANGDKAVQVTCHRVQFSPLKSLSLIGDDFADVVIEGELLSASGKGDNESKFFQIKMVN